ncbi:TIGR02117 family protein [Flavobacterium sp. LaA7.5]|nr:TIGR02117 family protein [Flavobacterium salilacus subsp. altitudinum]
MAKKTLKKILRYTARIVLGLFTFIMLYTAGAYILSNITVNSSKSEGNDVSIYIHTNGAHTDIIVPVKNNTKDWTADILFTHTKAQDSLARYIAFGWGDKEFYLNTPQWSDLKAGTAFRAAFHLGTSAIHTRFYTAVQEDENCIKVNISTENYQRLVEYISDSFAYDAHNKVQWIAHRGYGDHDAFYDAKRKYSLFYTCNTWTNNALKAANQKAAVWTPYDKGILCHYR